MPDGDNTVLMTDKYSPLKYPGWQLLVHNSVDPPEAWAVISAIQMPCPEKRLQRVASSGNARVFKGSISVDHSPANVFIKQYLFRSFWDFVKHLLRSSRAKRAFQASLMLRKYGHKAPMPLMLCEKKIGPCRTMSILVTQEAPGAMQLRRLLALLSRDKSKESLRKKRRLIREFAISIGKMHSQGIVHGDTRLGNVLVGNENEHFTFWFIDNESTRCFTSAGLKQIRKNLVQINIRAKVSRTDKMRFMHSYARHRKLSEDETKALITLVLEKTFSRIKNREHRKPGKSLQNK